MTTTDKSPSIEIAYQVGPGRSASRRFSVAALHQLSTFLFPRQTVREGLTERLTATVIAFLSQLLAKTPLIETVRDDSELVYRISTVAPRIRGDGLAQVDRIASALQLAIKTYRPQRPRRLQPLHRQHPQDVVIRTADRPVPVTATTAGPVPAFLRQLYYRSSTLPNPSAYDGGRIRSIPMGGQPRHR